MRVRDKLTVAHAVSHGLRGGLQLAGVLLVAADFCRDDFKTCVGFLPLRAIEGVPLRSEKWRLTVVCVDKADPRRAVGVDVAVTVAVRAKGCSIPVCINNLDADSVLR